LRAFRRALGAIVAVVTLAIVATGSATGSAQTSAGFDTSTLAGKVASLRSSAGLQVRFSAFIEQEAQDAGAPAGGPTAPITPTFVLSSPLDGSSIAGPAVTVNGDTHAAPQNETSIAVDPNNASTIVASANDYVTRTWSCTISGTPCSALGDGYSGTYLSTDGGAHWCCVSSDPSHLGTLIPGVTHLAGGPYDAGGDPAVAFDSTGHVYYSGLGFNRASAPNTVEVSRGTISGGSLSWGAPTFINATTSPSTLNDKEWIAVDAHASSPFKDRIYVTWTVFTFNPSNGNYVKSPIYEVHSSDGGQTFSAPQGISGNVQYDQGSRPVVDKDGNVSVFFEGSTRLAALSSTYVVKSTDGGATWGTPVAIATLTDSPEVKDTAFRVNSFPAAAAAPNGDLYATWTTAISDSGAANYTGDPSCAPWLGGDDSLCHSVAVYSKSTDGGATWSTVQPVFAAGNRVAVGYPVKQPDKTKLQAPSPTGPVEQIFPAVGIGPNGNVYLAAYSSNTVSPWQTCKTPASPSSVGRINCLELGPYIHNGRLDYVVRNLATTTQTVSTHPINTRSQFGGGFIGDYTDLAVGSNNVFHALWTDTNNKQTVTWFYGFEFTPTVINQEDIATASGSW
jgi:hypothetical protein